MLKDQSRRRTARRSSALLALLILALGASATVTYTQNQAAPANQPPAAAGQTPQAPPGQAATPTFRTSVQYVEVDVRVADNKGVPVRDLKKEDFKLLEDGVQQAVETFAAIDVKPETATTVLAATSLSAPAPDVATNAGASTLEGRLYVLMLDDRQIAPTRTQSTIRIAKQFIERNLGPKDMAAIVTSSGRRDVSQSFTSNKQALASAVDKFMGRKLESLAIQRLQARLYLDPVTEPLAAGQQTPTTDNDPLLEAEHFQEARLALQAFESVCDWLGGIKGVTKSLILLSEGVDYDTESDHLTNRWATEILQEQRLAVSSATRANVTVYPVDPRGMGDDDSIVASNAFRGDDGTLDLRASTSPPVSIATALRQEVDRARTSMREMADSTGGIEMLGTNDFDKALTRIVEHSSAYYLIGYHPKNVRREGRFRRITVTVNRPGVRVTARRGYGEPDANTKSPLFAGFNGPAGVSPAVSDALNSPLPINEMILSTTAVAFRGSSAGATVAVIIESPSLTFTPKDGKYVGSVEVVTAAVNDSNVIAAGTTSTVGFNLTAQSFQQVQQAGFRSLAELRDLKPGRYELRIAVAEKDTAKRGTVWYPFDVPDFSKGKLSMSGLLVSSLAEGKTPTSNHDKVLGDRTTIPPTAVRQFRVGDELTVVAEIYDNELKAEHQVDLTTTLRAADGTEAFNTSDWASFDELKAADGAYRISMWMPLADVTPGDYTISIEAKRQLDDDEKPVIRSIPIKIVK